MLQCLINLHFSCQKCSHKWKTEEGLVKLYFNAIFMAKENTWMIPYKPVLEDKECPKCVSRTKASSVWIEDVEKVAVELGLNIVRKISDSLNKNSEDSS